MQAAVRLGTVDDLAAIAAIDEQALAGSERWELLTGVLDGSCGSCLVAVVPDADGWQVVGYVALVAHQFFGRDFVELLVVGEESRRNGVGRALLAAAVRRAETSTVFTSTNESNGAMCALLASEAWLVSGTLTGLDAGDPEIVYYRVT